MKTKNPILKSTAKLLGIASASVLLFTVTSCNNPNTTDSKAIAEDHNDAKFENEKKDDANFLVNAAEINLEEIELGRLAQTRGISADVKELGKKMETAHSKALTDLQGLADKKQITIPATLTDDGMNSHKKLVDIKGSDFDKEYVDMMVKGHKDAISKFEKISSDGYDSDIRGWASSMLPIFREHLDEFITTQKQWEK